MQRSKTTGECIMYQFWWCKYLDWHIAYSILSDQARFQKIKTKTHRGLKSLFETHLIFEFLLAFLRQDYVQLKSFNWEKTGLTLHVGKFLHVQLNSISVIEPAQWWADILRDWLTSALIRQCTRLSIVDWGDLPDSWLRTGRRWDLGIRVASVS